MASLTKLVDEMRAQVQFDIPLFDPLDGGVNAECLFLLEAPGPKAVCTGFVSRNNPDETAKNLMLLSIEAGIDRERTILWNVVPWYIGNGSVIRGATASDVREGLPYLFRLLELLTELQIVALVGRPAGRVRSKISQRYPNLEIVEMPHPSPTFINRSEANRNAVVEGFVKVSGLLANKRKMRTGSREARPH
jgi:uracil-DNA glycosylase